jgi:hypothetical protein
MIERADFTIEQAHYSEDGILARYLLRARADHDRTSLAMLGGAPATF